VQIGANSRRIIQAFLLVAMVAAAIRMVVIYSGRQRRSAPVASQSKQEKPLNPDYYVSPKKLHPYDLKSAREITKQPVWVKEGYRYTYYPYDPQRHRSNFTQEAGELGPLERLEIQDVVTDVSPGSKDQRQVMAVFEKNGESYAVPIGAVKNRDYQIYSDEMFYIQDPRQFYNHWPAEVWQAIEKHEVKPGMSELQAAFAIGMGIPQQADDPALRLVKYPNGGRPLVITYRDGKAVEIKPASA
jgi:hypothetical protein